MMDFLRGLAPRRDGDSRWAAPVVPSRFGQVQPLAIEPSSAGERATVIPAAAREHRPAELQVTPAARDERPRATHLASPVTESVSLRLPPVSTHSEVHHHHHEVAAASRVVSPVVALSTVPRLITRDEMTAPVEPASMLRAEAPSVDRRSSPSVSLQAPFVQPLRVQSPLSPAAVAERKATPAIARPIVHVTIDRLEVRAPGATRPAARASRGRTTSPGVSLSDYLRGPRKGGGAL